MFVTILTHISYKVCIHTLGEVDNFSEVLLSINY